MTKILVFLVVVFGVLFGINSCTIISSRNIPGEQLSEFPEEIRGEYELIFPEELQSMMELDTADLKKSTVIIDAKRLTQVDENKTYLLGDSIFVSKVGEEMYLSIRSDKNYSVMKMEREHEDIQLYGMYTYETVTKKELKKYFSKVELQKLPKTEGEEESALGEDDLGIKMYVVTINDKKLNAYFKSQYAHTNATTLRKIK